MSDFKQDLIIFLLLILFGVLLNALFLWGLGNLIIYVFRISYDWTFWHGVVATIVLMMLGWVPIQIKID